jgi:murein DD-endopeptidase MepM/ murein hydrolase activator NlpD
VSETSKNKASESQTASNSRNKPSNGRAIELVRANPPAPRPEVMIGEEEVRRGSHRVPLTTTSAPLRTPRRDWFSISIATSPDKPPLRLRLGKITGTLFLLVVLTLLAGAAFGIFSAVSGTITDNGDSLAWQNSASVREQQRQRVIDLQERRLNDLQEENQKRLIEIGQLEGQLQDLGDSINSLKTVARQLQDLLGLSSSSQIPLVPSTVRPQGSDSSQYIPPVRLNGGYLDPVQGQQYLDQFNGLLSKLDSFSQLLQNRKQSLTDYTLTLNNYRQDLSQQRADLNSASASLSQLSKLGDTDAAPDVLPWYGQITSPYGWRMSPFRPGVREFHYGLDINASEGTPVQVTKSGIVTYIGYDSSYGNMVEVTHAGGWLTRYAHNSKVLVQLGQTVRRGDILALSGNTGASTGPHIHYEVHHNGMPIDPATLVPTLTRR